MDASDVVLRTATGADLAAINRVLERAVMTWNLPERVKRLSLPVYRYSESDFDSLHFRVAVNADGGLIGVAAWEPADPRESPERVPAMLLHGLYVDPQWHGEGVGSRLLADVVAEADAQSLAGVLVRAQRDAEGFFHARGFQPIQGSERYPRLWWRPSRGQAG